MISKKNMEKLASLTRIEVSDKELETLQHDLERILLYADQLNRAEIGSVDTFGNIMGLENVMRSDSSELRVEADIVELIEAAPALDTHYIKVPAIWKR